MAEPTSSVAECPGCGAPSEHVHGRYTRTVADLPWQGRRVVLRLAVRRFQCRNAECTKRTFTERVPIVDIYAQTTTRLTAAHRSIGFALGGEAGARLADRLTMPTGPDTLLRRVRQADPGTAPSPRVLGVDDFAFRRGRTYGTILVDLERRRVVDLLPDREAATLAAWLRAHPGVEVITRDRATAYAQAASVAAPAAMQVADRWHLLSNMRDVLERSLQQRSKTIRELLAPAGEGDTAGPAAGGMSEHPTDDRDSAARARRQERFDEARRMHGEGHSIRGIAAAPGLHYRTVERHVRSDACPDWDPGRRRPSAVDPFEAYIRRRLSEGCRKRCQIRRELEAPSYRGGKTAVRDYVRRLEDEMGMPSSTAPPATPPRVEVPSDRRLAVSVVSRPADRSAEDRGHLETLRAGDATMGSAIELAERFAALIRGRDPGGLADWLTGAETSSAVGLRSFARRLRQDEAAVRAGLTVEWSNGPVEGLVNRLKIVATDYPDCHSPSLTGYTAGRAVDGVPGAGRLGPPTPADRTGRIPMPRPPPPPPPPPP